MGEHLRATAARSAWGRAPAGLPGPDAPTQALWAWNGDRDYAPRKLTTVVPKDVEPHHTDNAGAWEGIGEMPERLTPGAKVRLITDLEPAVHEPYLVLLVGDRHA